MSGAAASVGSVVRTVERHRGDVDRLRNPWQLGCCVDAGLDQHILDWAARRRRRLTSSAMVPEHQPWTLDAPHRSRIHEGLRWAAATPPQETDVEALLKGRTRQVRRARGRRR
jgi:hypothetical protein